MLKRAQPDACTLLAQRAHFLGASGISNNRAEFTALLDGLALARDFLAQDAAGSVAGLLVAVHGDSAVAIDVMGGRAECRDPALAELAERALAVVQELQARDCEVDFQHVRRAFNSEADRLANVALDAEADSLTRAPDFALARAQLPLPSPDAAPEPPREPSDSQQPWSDQAPHPAP